MPHSSPPPLLESPMKKSPPMISLLGSRQCHQRHHWKDPAAKHGIRSTSTVLPPRRPVVLRPHPHILMQRARNQCHLGCCQKATTFWKNMTNALRRNFVTVSHHQARNLPHYLSCTSLPLITQISFPMILRNSLSRANHSS
jgi:hypothetical protein